MRILVAHQDARIRGRLIRAARDFRASDVDVTGSPEETLTQVRSWHPDVVVMSASMAERYGTLAHAEDADLRAGSASGEVVTDLAGSGRLKRRNLRWDRDRAAQELAAILVAMDVQPPAPRLPRRGRDAHMTATSRSSIGQLSDPEREILSAVAAGSTTTELAAQYGVAEAVIDGHVSDVVAKLHRLEVAP